MYTSSTDLSTSSRTFFLELIFHVPSLDFEVEHKGSDSKLGKVEAEESYGISQASWCIGALAQWCSEAVVKWWSGAVLKWCIHRAVQWCGHELHY